MWQVWEKREILTEFWWGDLKERNNLENISIDGMVNLKFILNKIRRAWTGLM
jgi:hypothetical protein